MTELVPMTVADFLAFVAETIPRYAADKVTSGQWSAEESVDLARKALDDLLPRGLDTPDNHLFTIRAGSESAAVGRLWFAVQQRAGKRIAFVYEISIEPERQGHASRAFMALENTVRDLGLSGVALHVFGHNAAALALYAKLGYVPTDINMYKPVRRVGA
jgi:ribosomal protein S18 acetylase RimI-like enzyme